MGCFHEPELPVDEEHGFSLNSPRFVLPEHELDHSLRSPEREAIAGRKKHGIAEQRRQILELYDEFRPRLQRYIRSMNLRREQAEEIIQETFLRLTSELREGEDDIENVQGWIVRVTHNLVVDAIKKRERDMAHRVDLSANELEAFVDTSEGPEETYRSKEQLLRIETALSTLNPQQRQCFKLRAQGIRYRDIAETLGISEQRAALVVKQVTVRLAAFLFAGGTRVG